MNRLIDLYQGYKITLLHFISIAKKEIFLLIYLIIAFFSQIVFGLDYFNNFFIAIGYSVGTFLFISIAYSLTFNFTDKQTDNVEIKNINIQLVIIGFVVVTDFIFVIGHLPDNFKLKIITQPIRIFLYDTICTFGFSKEFNGILVNNFIAILLPLTFLLIITRQLSGYYINRINLKILFLLLLLYLPIILFGYKSLNEIISDLPYYLMIAAIPEEFLYRGLLQSRIERIFKNPISAILLSSLIFGLMHLPINIKMYGVVTGFATCIGNNAFGGLFIGYLFYRTRSIWTVIIFHLISGIALT